jgi:hypothetical protein
MDTGDSILEREADHLSSSSVTHTLTYTLPYLYRGESQLGCLLTGTEEPSLANTHLEQRQNRMNDTLLIILLTIQSSDLYR